MGDNVLTGLLPGGSSSVLRFSSHQYDGKWTEVEGITTHLLDHIQPCWPSEEKRLAVTNYVERLIKHHFDCQVYTFGSVPLKTYLPNGDIDITVFSWLHQLNKSWATDLQSILKREEHNRDAKFRVKEVQRIHAEVQIVKCLVDDIIVDISFNQLGGLCTLCFLEEVDQLIGRNHFFKRSIILIKAWCFYESRILGAHHGLISTYALETLVLYIFHIFHASLHGPLEVLFKFLAFFSQFDWEQYCLSLWGPIHLSALQDMTAEPPERPGRDMLLSHEFLHKCSQVNAVFSAGQEITGRMFTLKYMNVMDPLRIHNNLGRSVSRGNLSRIRSAFALGAKKLEKLLSGPHDDLTGNLNDFFFNTRNNCTVNRLDALTVQVVGHATMDNPSCGDQGENTNILQSESELKEAANSTHDIQVDICRDFDNAVDLASDKDKPCACKFQFLQGGLVGEKTCSRCLSSPVSVPDPGNRPLSEKCLSSKSSRVHSEANLVINDEGWCKGSNSSSCEFALSGNNQSANQALRDGARGAGSDESTEDDGESRRIEDYEASSKCYLTCTLEDEKGFIASGTPSSLTDSLLMYFSSDETFPAVADTLTDDMASVPDQKHAVEASNSLAGGAHVNDSKESEARLEEETTCDILKGDIVTHLSNLHVGRWILTPQHYEPWMFPPTSMFPAHQEPFFWDSTGRPFGNMNTSVHGYLPKSEQFPVSSINGLGSQQVAFPLHAQMFQSQFHRGTGTYLPNLHPSGVYKERHMVGHSRNYRGGKAVDFNDMSSQVGDNPFLSRDRGTARETRNEGRLHGNKVIARSEKSYFERKAAQKWPEVSQEHTLHTSLTNGDINLRLTCAVEPSGTSTDSSGRKELHFYSVDKPNPSSTISQVQANDRSPERSKSGLLSLPTSRKSHQSNQEGLSTQWGRSMRDYQGLRCGEHSKLRDGIVPLKCSSLQNSYDEEFPPLPFSNQLRSSDACDVEKSPVTQHPHDEGGLGDSLV